MSVKIISLDGKAYKVPATNIVGLETSGNIEKVVQDDKLILVGKDNSQEYSGVGIINVSGNIISANMDSYYTVDEVNGLFDLTTNEINAASAYAYEQAIAQIPAPFDPTFLSGEIDKKMDKTFSSNFYPMNENPSGYLTEHQDLSAYATKVYVNEEIGKVGSYVTATLVNNVPDVQNPSNKKIYLTKDDTITGTDLYKEWIYTESSAWECIGDTSMNLSDYVPLSARNCNIGSDNIVGYSTSDSFAQGRDNTATNCCLVQGRENSAGTDSLVQGTANSAASDAFAQGQINYAYWCSIAQGQQNSASQNSIAQGLCNSAITASFAQGIYNSAYGYAFAQGSGNSANNFAFAQGNLAFATTTSFAQGFATSSTDYSFAQGYVVSAYNLSLGQGQGVFVSNSSVGFGVGINITNNAMAIGSFNKTTNTANESAAFVIGNGKINQYNGQVTASDAFVVYKNGKVSAASDIYTSAGQVMIEPTALVADKQYGYTTTGWEEISNTLPDTVDLVAGEGIVFRDGSGADSGKTFVDIDSTNYKLLTTAEYATLTAVVNLVSSNSGSWVLTGTN